MSETIKQQPEQTQTTTPEVDYENMVRSDYLQLPKEEQDRIFEMRQQRVREAPTLYEWEIRVTSLYSVHGYGLGWLLFLSPNIAVALLGAYLIPDETFLGVGLIIMPLLMGLCARYLWLADKIYHYRLTTEGLVETEREAIPDIAYTIMRGLAWFGVVVCIAAVAVLGPAALVGAGGFAVGAFFFTGFKNQERTTTYVINDWQKHVIKVTRNRPFIWCQSGTPLGADDSNYRMYCPPTDAEFYNLMSIISNQLPHNEIRLFKNERELDDAGFASFDAGEPAQLSDFAPRSADS